MATPPLPPPPPIDCAKMPSEFVPVRTVTAELITTLSASMKLKYRVDCVPVVISPLLTTLTAPLLLPAPPAPPTEADICFASLPLIDPAILRPPLPPPPPIDCASMPID